MVNFQIKMERASWIMLIGYIILSLLDFYTTFRNGELAQYMEYNPIFVLTNSWFWLMLVNILGLYIMLKIYNSKRMFDRFSVCSFFCWMAALRIIVIINNFKVAKRVDAGLVDVAAVKAVEASTKIAAYTYEQIIMFLLPMLISLAIYGLFSIDNKAVRREEYGMVS